MFSLESASYSDCYFSAHKPVSEAEELEPEFLSHDLVFISGAVEPLRVISHEEMAWADFEMMVENGQVIEGRDGAHV